MTKKTDSIFESKRYVEYTYDTGVRPYGKYPGLLASWLLDNVYKKPGKIADFGCGRGDYLEVFQDLGFTPTGFDISPSINNIEGYNVKQVDFVNDTPPYTDENFDYVFSKSVVEHLHNPTSYMTGIYESLSAGGVAVIMTPSWEHSYWGPFYIDHTHVTPFTARSLRSALEMIGFKRVTVKYFYQLPFLWKYPLLIPIIKLLSKLPVPYGPFYDVPWSDNNKINKLIRFSKEPMLLAIASR